MPKSVIILDQTDCEQLSGDLSEAFYAVAFALKGDYSRITPELKHRLRDYSSFFAGGENYTDVRTDADKLWPKAE